MARWIRWMAVAGALLARPVAAHEHGDRAMGIVASVTPERIVIRASDGHEVPFTVDAGTRWFVGGKPATARDVREGQRAVVHGKRSGDGLTAVRVKLAPAR